MDEVKLTFARFQCGRYFARQLDALRAFRGDYVSGGLLENLEVAGLLAPQIRLHYPDDVARRFWSLDHPEMKAKGTIEPDGARWDIAVELRNALYRWHRQYPYGPYAHPFESGEARYEAFFFRSPFGHCDSERERGVDVSNDVHPTLSDSSYEQTFYTTWQLLVATEIADCGVHFRINLADDEVRRAAWEAVGEGRAPGPTGRFAFRPVHAMRGFEKHARALDAVVLFAEERQRGLDLIVQNLPGRFRLSEEQNAVYQACRRDAAQEAVVRYQVNTAALVDLCRFLAERWCDWHRDGRPLIAGAYKAVLGEAVVLLRVREHLSFAEVRDRIGEVGGWFKPILDVIWPDWVEEEKARVRRTLMVRVADSSSGELTAADVDGFVGFLAEEKLEGFFWRLRSFEDHAFHGHDYALEGMQSDLQGIAVAVEHVARALGAEGKTLYDLFKQLWGESDIGPLLRRNIELSRRRNTPGNWADLKVALCDLRAHGRAERIVADLLLAHRIRGDVHRVLPESDELILEEMVVAVMRAAALTFAQARRSRRTSLPASAA